MLSSVSEHNDVNKVMTFTMEIFAASSKQDVCHGFPQSLVVPAFHGFSFTSEVYVLVDVFL